MIEKGDYECKACSGCCMAQEVVQMARATRAGCRFRGQGKELEALGGGKGMEGGGHGARGGVLVGWRYWGNYSRGFDACHRGDGPRAARAQGALTEAAGCAGHLCAGKGGVQGHQCAVEAEVAWVQRGQGDNRRGWARCKW